MYLFQFKLANPMNVSDILAADIIHVDVDTVAIDIKRALDLNTITHDHQTESVISLELISIMVGTLPHYYGLLNGLYVSTFECFRSTTTTAADTTNL